MEKQCILTHTRFHIQNTFMVLLGCKIEIEDQSKNSLRKAFLNIKHVIYYVWIMIAIVIVTRQNAINLSISLYVTADRVNSMNE